MDEAQAGVEAARRLVAALDTYEAKFHAMVAARMDSVAYDEVNTVIEQVRAAKMIIFSRVATESVEFLLAHSSLMTALWDVQLAQLRGTPSQHARALPALTADHDHSIEQLRGACEKIIDGAPKSTRRPPAAPGVGF